MYSIAAQESIVECAIQFLLHLGVVDVGHGTHCGLQQEYQNQYEHVLK